MPELPEVETMRRGISGVVGGRITDVVRPRCRLRPISIEPEIPRLRRRVVGCSITAVDRLGKRLVLRLDDQRQPSPDALVIEPRMTGLVLVADPPDREHLRFGLKLAGGGVPEMWFWDRRGLGSVRLFTDHEFLTHFGSDRFGRRRVGPDALQISLVETISRLGGSRREIKVALLDQRALAGVGNLYASEILHLAKINPERRCLEIKRAEWQRLHAAMRKVLRDAIRHEGSTLSDGTYRNALNNAGSYQHRHRVYDRADEPCGTCGMPIVRIVQAQRSTFFCRRCQPNIA